jgi:hypothetical protein
MGLNWIELKGKRVHLILKNNFEYNGLISDVDDRKNGIVFLSFIDKFEKKFIFSTGEIKLLEIKE